MSTLADEEETEIIISNFSVVFVVVWALFICNNNQRGNVLGYCF